MRQVLQTWQQIWRSEAGSRLWLSSLIAAMEEASQPDIRRKAVEAETLAQFRAQLALPASLRHYPKPTSGLRH
jgi:hypothetical protein